VRTTEDSEVAARARRRPTPTRKDVAAVLKVRSGRLYEAMRMGRAWPAPLWRVLFAGHRWPGFR